MNDQLGLIIKVLLLSLGLSLLIKYGGRLLLIAPTDTNAIIGIAVPPLVMALALWWRSRKP